MGNSLQFFPWIAFLFLQPCGNQAHGNYTKSQGHPGFQVLKSASHYWPLEVVNGIRELPRVTEGRMGPVGNDSSRTVIIHNYIVLPYHNSSSVHSNDSSFPNLSATVDIVEGTVNHGIVLNGQKGVTLLYFGSSKNSCISDPSLCGPEGVTFSFFWKIQDLSPKKQLKPINQSNNQESFQDDSPKSQQTQAFGKKVTSHGFQIYSDEREGYVEVYTHEDSKVWKARIKPPGPYWTHVLFTWTSSEGLKVYVNSTFNASDSQGQHSYSYGAGADRLIVGTNSDPSKHYVNGAFDEFIIWERALSPPEIHLYFTAAIGDETFVTATTSSTASTSDPPVSTDAYYPIIINLTQDGFKTSHAQPVLGYLDVVSQILPNKSLTQDTAGNLTQAFLKTVEEVLSLPTWTEIPSAQPEVAGLIDTVDKVIGHMARNLLESPSVIVTLEGRSSVADYSMVKVPQALSLPHYRFPSEGQSYISVPGEAFLSKFRTTIVGLLYHTMHRHYKQIKPSDTRISEANQSNDYMISAASYIISLKVEPPPYLCPNLSGSPLITIQLTHILFPKNSQEWQDVAAQFAHLWDFPNCGGAIDGKHVRIVPPPNSGSYFFNYKGFSSIVLLAVVSAKYEFLYVDVGINGRHSDGGVMMNTEFYDRLQRGTLNLPRAEDNVEGLNFVFVADDAFSLGPHILKPFPMRNLTPEQRIFNYRLSRARRVVENAFGIMSSRFRIFLTAINLAEYKLNHVVLCCCILHNFLRRNASTYIGLGATGEPAEESLMPALESAHAGFGVQNGRVVRQQYADYFIGRGAVPWQQNVLEN